MRGHNKLKLRCISKIQNKINIRIKIKIKMTMRLKIKIKAMGR